MGVFVIVAYRPKKDQEPKLKSAIKDHLTVLNKEGLTTEYPPLVLKAKDGTYLEIFEWKSEQAMQQAHGNKAVQALWKRFEQACDYVPLSTLEETKQLFAHFDPVALT